MKELPRRLRQQPPEKGALCTEWEVRREKQYDRNVVLTGIDLLFKVKRSRSTVSVFLRLFVFSAFAQPARMACAKGRKESNAFRGGKKR